MSPAAKEPFNVLLVEDNPGDVDLVLETFSESDTKIHCSVAADGVEALRMLRDAPHPHLIVLDLNLPKKSGREVLREIKGDDQLKQIPVIVLTSSEAERDLADVYRLQANCVLTKPVDLEEFQAVIGAIDKFWLRTVKLPPISSRQ